jgi:hypothetical protein
MNIGSYTFPSVKSLLFLSMLLLCSAFRAPEHALYLSVSEVKLQPEGKSTIRIKVFSDDLQNAIRNYSSAYQHDGLQEFFEKNERLIMQYFQEHLQMSINGKPVRYSYQEHSVEQDAHFITYRFSWEGEATKISMEADFFMELFPTQTNIIKVQQQDEQFYFKFTHPAGPQEFTWSR